MKTVGLRWVERRRLVIEGERRWKRLRTVFLKGDIGGSVVDVVVDLLRCEKLG
jgi:hypothetical protein